MTVQRVLYLLCNRQGCDHKLECGEEQSAGRARVWAQELGWMWRDLGPDVAQGQRWLDFCPSHSADAYPRRHERPGEFR
jgi:hypothetical protein